MRPSFLIAVLAAALLGCSVSVQHGLDEAAANEVVTALERAGIGAEKVRDDEARGATSALFVVRVAQADAVRALELLRSLGLPRGQRSGFAQVYKQPSLVPTATEERARYVEALAGEVERTLESVEDVVSARVHLVLSETDPLAVDGKPRVPARASVLLKVKIGATPLKEPEVQRLVAGSVPGLEPPAVAVVLTAAPAGPDERQAALAALGPLRMTAASRTLVLGALVGALALVGVLAIVLIMTARRLAALQRLR